MTQASERCLVWQVWACADSPAAGGTSVPCFLQALCAVAESHGAVCLRGRVLREYHTLGSV